MRVIILDNGLGDAIGHHQHMARHMGLEVRRYGCQPTLYATKSTPPALAEEVGARPIFSDGFYEDIGADAFRAFAKSRRYLEEFTGSGQVVSPGDLIFVPTASPIEMYALLYWARRRDDLQLKFGFVIHNMDHPALTDPLRSYLWAACADLLGGLSADRAWLCATNPVLAADVANTLRRKPRVELSSTWYAGSVDAPRPLGPQVRVGFVGDMREPKGAHRIPSLVRTLRAQHPDWRIVVHCERGNAFMPLFAPLRGDPGVDLVEERLDDEQLSRLVNSLDVVICPYQRAIYRHGSSGVLSLAAGLGVPCVAPSGTTLAAQLKSAARPLGGVYHGDTDQAVVHAVAEIVNRRELNAAEAPAAAARWRRFASGEGLMRNLLQWAGVDVGVVPAGPP